MEDLRSCKARTLQETGRCDTAAIAAKLAGAGHRVMLRTSLGGGHGQDCFQVIPNIDHTVLALLHDIHDLHSSAVSEPSVSQHCPSPTIMRRICIQNMSWRK